jgi:hypothetical protein
MAIAGWALHRCGQPAFADRFTSIPLSNPSAAVEAHVAWRKDESNTTILNFVDFARQMFASKERRSRKATR